MMKASKILGLILFVVWLGGSVNEAAAQGGQCYGASCGQGTTCGGGKNYANSRPCCCGMACLVKPDHSVTCMCDVGCFKQCGTACAPGCHGSECGTALVGRPPDSIVASAPFDPGALEIVEAATASGYGAMITPMLSNFSKCAGGTGAGPLPTGAKMSMGNVDTYFLPEPWKSLPKPRNVVAYQGLVTVDGPEATITLVFDRVPGRRYQVQRVPPPVRVRLTMGSSAAEVATLSVDEKEDALIAIQQTRDKQAAAGSIAQ